MSKNTQFMSKSVQFILKIKYILKKKSKHIWQVVQFIFAKYHIMSKTANRKLQTVNCEQEIT